jgi:hypothetical protein
VSRLAVHRYGRLQAAAGRWESCQRRVRAAAAGGGGPEASSGSGGAKNGVSSSYPSTPVIMPQPTRAALSRGKSLGILSTAASGMVDIWEKVETPAKWRTGVPLRLKCVVPSGIRPVTRISVPTSQRVGRPPVQYSHAPQETRQIGMTWSPGSTEVTPLPTVRDVRQEQAERLTRRPTRIVETLLDLQRPNGLPELSRPTPISLR